MMLDIPSENIYANAANVNTSGAKKRSANQTVSNIIHTSKVLGHSNFLINLGTRNH